MKKRSIATILVLAALPLFLGVSGGTPSSAGYRFAFESAPYAETVIGWMLGNGLEKAVESVQVSAASRDQVASYFRVMARRLRPSAPGPDSSSETTSQAVSLLNNSPAPDPDLEQLKPAVERRIQQQVASALVRDGVVFRVGASDLLFPPVLFRFASLPNLLVVSPRSHIERLTTVLLTPNLEGADAEKLEGAIDSEGYAALVTPIGGLGVYPSMVPENADPRWTARTVAHEWSHQFFALRPLGWRYAFGSERDERMVIVNETAAEIVGREVGDRVYSEDYGGDISSSPFISPRDKTFRDAMRDIRSGVDVLLAAGKVDEAESYMEQSRQLLVKRGYNLRKLNQAYFAFNGSYTDELAIGGSVGDDIAARIHTLRDRCSTLGDFVWAISSLGSYDQFLAMTSAEK